MSKKAVSKGGVIIFNKPFLGQWLDDPSHIGHEIIDFFKTDKDEIYVYNSPYGQAPNKNIRIGPGGAYNLKYLVLTGPTNTKEKEFEILYVIELEEILHRLAYVKHKKEENRSDHERKALEKRQKEVKEIIRNKDIKYNGKYLYEIFGDNLYVTFKASKIYKVTKPISVKMDKYLYQRNKGVLREDEFGGVNGDYSKAIKAIEDSIKDGTLKEYDPPKVTDGMIAPKSDSLTFVDLIMQNNNEQIFTNVIYSLLKDGNLLYAFCREFDKTRQLDSGKFSIFRESKIVDGRMDICAESANQRIVIENKIYSGLNGKKDNKTQLSTYHKWAKEKKMDPFCFVIVPDSRKALLKSEISKHDTDMDGVYTLVTYGQLADFLEKQKTSLAGYTYEKYIDDLVKAFNNLSKLTDEDLYARMFLEKTMI